MRIVITLFCILMAVPTLMAQKILELRDGTTVKVKEFFLNDDKVEVKPFEGKKYVLKPDTIALIHDIDEEVNYIFATYKNDERELKWARLELLENGPLRLYGQFVLTSNTNGASALYVGKGTSVRWIYSTNTWFQGKDNQVELLKKLVSDDPVLLQEVSSPDFKLSEITLTSIVRRYNLQRWPGVAEGPTGICYFYLKANGKWPTDASIVINDGEAIEVYSTKATMVNLPVNGPSKVCLGSYCQTVMPDPYFAWYFEIEEDPAKVGIQKVLSKKAKREIQYRYQKSLTH